MEKRSINLVFLIVLGVFLLGFISSASCSITTSCPDTNNRVMRLSSSTNAHGELWNQSNYAYYLCCDFAGIHTCNEDNKVLKLSNPTNAHAEILTKNNYPFNVCFGNLSCFSTTSSSCPPGNFSMLSLSAETNAHLGEFDDYT